MAELIEEQNPDDDSLRERIGASESSYSEIYRQRQEEQFNMFRLKSQDWIDVVAREYAGEEPEIKIIRGEAIWTGKWVQSKNKTVSVNGFGASLIKTLFLNYANKDSHLSYLDLPTIKNICMNMKIDLAVAFGFYYKKYGVPLHIRNMVINNIVNKIYISLTRAIKGREADLISKGYQHISHETSALPRQGMFDKLRGFVSPRR